MKIAIVIGASSGIGAEIAKQLQDKRAVALGGTRELWLIARRAELLALRAAEMQGPLETRVFPGDVIDTMFLKEIAGELESGQHEISWLVLSAGTGRYGDFEETGTGEALGCIDVNCRSLTAATAVLAPFFSKDARVVILASGASFFPQPGFAVYAATKAYALSFARALGKELCPKGVSVTAVCPGPCDTEFIRNASDGKPVPKVKQLFMTTPDKVARRAVSAAIKRRKVCCPTFGMKAARAGRHVLPDAVAIEFFAAGSKNGEK
ncbi:MAG: SDR family NAD(P)-dependent oxidoreductase [Clostridia bacterium]|nr:SDR family NAD(P)-dependent oxidoreductase [Clostridia bacterium]MBO7503914.1 SDR family NAD(P)-dependent oxidoreductase [Clostridia bacterium]MBO7658143.1 SDR family NAD(P)-dependent oxidoreductase [Clostridia bacterium]MBP5765640.1 SDR family NAD(P)-dependent oxidoreductase [Clostridia bacterium]